MGRSRAHTGAREQEPVRAVVELVRTAQARSPRSSASADRYAVWFTPVTLLVCLVAWLATGEPVRVLAVLVVAPHARSSSPRPWPSSAVGTAPPGGHHIRHGSALEQLAAISVAVFDKTGTLTIGRLEVARVLPGPGFTEADVLRLAGAVEHGSGHLLARTLVDAAVARTIDFRRPATSVEAPGEGVTGEVEEDRTVCVGGWAYVVHRHPSAEPGLRDALGAADGAGLRAYVAVEGLGAGVVEYADRVRPGVPGFLTSLRGLGVRRTILLSGTTRPTPRRSDAAWAWTKPTGSVPGEKVAFVQALVRAGDRVLMVGDGTNDAPALSSATVGIALASGGGGITAEAADAVLLADDPARIAEAIAISRRTLRLARQSIWVGLGLSAAAMIVASFGYLPPTAGALLQEGIDVAVILNALRATFDGDARPVASR